MAKKRGAFGIKSTGQKIERNAPTVLAQYLWVAHAGERVVIGDEIERLAFRLKRNSRLHHAKIIADVERTAGLNSGKNAHELDKISGSRSKANLWCGL